MISIRFEIPEPLQPAIGPADADVAGHGLGTEAEMDLGIVGGAVA
jgi:hypothetical protein